VFPPLPHPCPFGAVVAWRSAALRFAQSPPANGKCLRMAWRNEIGSKWHQQEEM